MTVDDSTRDRFPVGMRVLAVDDDPTCLRVLESLLSRCQYQVTTTNQAITALKMLRENKNNFDLVISDVHMPDMDGFKLLELVGLEMDLPVIMLSAYGDPKLVMQGITHGACDYLLKPVRIEELKNIWQHVIRRQKMDSKPNKSNNEDKARHEGEECPPSMASSDQNEKLNKKRKDQNEEDGDDSEEDGQDNDDPSNQKKPRVVWSVELHRKFVGAVDQLGIEKAVPKRILDLMNVEGLTRENVASHLQKYRLYLKRISTVAAQQANMVAALGGKDPSYIRMGSIDGLGDFRTLAASGRLPNNAISSYLPGGMLGRLNTPAGLSIRGLTSTSIIQTGPGSNTSNNAITTLAKLQNPNLFQGIPTSLELDQLQPNRCIEFNTVDDPTIFNSFQNNPLIIQGSPQQTHNRGGFGTHKVASLNPEPSFDPGVSGSSNFLDYGRCNENWQNAVQLSNLPTNPLPLSEPFISNIPNNSLDFSSPSSVSMTMEDSKVDMPSHGGLINGYVPNHGPTQHRWEEHRQDYGYSSNNIFSSLNSMAPSISIVGPVIQRVDQNNAVLNRRMDVPQIGQSNGGALSIGHHGGVQKLPVNTKARSQDNYLMESTKPQGGFGHNATGDSLEDLMSAIIKREQDESTLMQGEFGYDAYSLGSCI